MLTEQEFIQLRAATGVPVLWRQAKPPNDTRNLVCITGPIDARQDVMVNAYGVNGRTFQILAADLPAAPEKFDQLELGGERYTINDVIPQHVRGAGTVVSYRVFCKGR